MKKVLSAIETTAVYHINPSCLSRKSRLFSQPLFGFWLTRKVWESIAIRHHPPCGPAGRTAPAGTGVTGEASFGWLFIIRLQIIKDIRIIKLPDRDTQSLGNLIDIHDARILALALNNTFIG